MKLKKQSLKEIGAQLGGPGKIFDQSTYRGNVRGLLFACAATYLMWHTYDLLAWGRTILDIPYEVDVGKQSWARVWAVIIGGTGILTPIIAMIMIPINRRRARESATGQWYDRPDLTHEALHEETSDAPPEAERRVRPEPPETPAQWQQESTPAHLVMPPAASDNKRASPDSEHRDGHTTLIVPDTEAQGRINAKKG